MAAQFHGCFHMEFTVHWCEEYASLLSCVCFSWHINSHLRTRSKEELGTMAEDEDDTQTILNVSMGPGSRGLEAANQEQDIGRR
jgi:hypothetical protein